MENKVTIHQVAAKVGCSIATVSRALNGAGRGGPIKPATQAAVRAAAEELGYVSPAARGAAKDKRPKLLGCIVPDLLNPFYAELAQTICDQALAQNCRVVLLTTGEASTPSAKREMIQLLLRQRVQGIVAVPTGSNSDGSDASIWQAVLNQHVGLVFVDRDLGRELPTVDTVTVDNKKGARDATWHLFTNGHERVGILTGPDTASTLNARLEGFKEAHDARGIRLDEKLIQVSTFKQDDRLRAARNLLAMTPPPTAVFATSNLFGESMLTAIREVWEDEAPFSDHVSLVMFDEAPWARLIVPRITTVPNPASSLAKTALDQLLYRLHTMNLDAPARHIVVRTGGLQVRESVSDLQIMRARAAQARARETAAVPSAPAAVKTGS